MRAWGNCLIFYKFQRAFDIIGKTQMFGQWPNACRDAILWACEREWWVDEHQQVSMRILFDTWDRILCDAEEYFVMCSWMNDIFGWKWMNFFMNVGNNFFFKNLNKRNRMEKNYVGLFWKIGHMKCWNHILY
jgi:hypothetical protein